MTRPALWLAAFIVNFGLLWPALIYGVWLIYRDHWFLALCLVVALTAATVIAMLGTASEAAR